jgi:hypothetical protein
MGHGQAVRQWTLDPPSQVRILVPQPFQLARAHLCAHLKGK